MEKSPSISGSNLLNYSMEYRSLEQVPLEVAAKYFAGTIAMVPVSDFMVSALTRLGCYMKYVLRV